MKRRTILIGLLALVACEAGPFSAEGPGGLNLIVTPNAAAGAFATGRVIIDGPTQVDRVLESGTHTFNDLQVGSYRVAVEIRGTGQDVAMLAVTSGVTVTANQTTSVTLTPTDFTPTLAPSGSGTAGVPFSVSIPPVTNAAAYIFENDDNAEFSSPESVEVTSPTTQITVPATGTHYVRVRSKTAFGGTQCLERHAGPLHRGSSHAGGDTVRDFVLTTSGRDRPGQRRSGYDHANGYTQQHRRGHSRCPDYIE